MKASHTRLTASRIEWPVLQRSGVLGGLELSRSPHTHAGRLTTRSILLSSVASIVCGAGAGHRLNQHSIRRMRAVSRRSVRVPEAIRLVAVKDGQLAIDELGLSMLAKSLSASSCEHIAVVSIAGALRQGKSFFLDLFARYLESKSSEGWLAESLQDHQRFHWRSGMERITEGIWVCPHVFKGPSSAKTRVGLLLLDTQGTYEPGAARWQNNSLLGLAGLLSATLLFNVSKQLQQDTIEDLQVAMELLHMSCRHHGRPRPPSDSKNLTFLVRDWAHEEPLPNDASTEPGLLMPMNAQEHQILTTFVHSTTAGQGLGQFFESLECRTLPHPGHIDSPSWGGMSSEISLGFIGKCQRLFDALSTAASAQVGAAIAVQDFQQTLRDSVAVLNSSQELPESDKSYSVALSDLSMLTAVERARSCYRASMYRSGALMKGKARLPEILLGDVAATRALVAEELAGAHREAVMAATAELQKMALFSEEDAVAQSVSELEDTGEFMQGRKTKKFESFRHHRAILKHPEISSVRDYSNSSPADRHV